MTNSEMIQKLEADGLSSASNMDFITNALEENDKLKAEIERIKEEVLANKNWSDVVERTLKKEIDKNEMLKSELEQWQSTNLKLVCELTRIECENNQLKSELEQSVKLPCKVGDIICIVSYYFDCKIDYKCKRYDEFGYDACNGCEHNFKKYFIKEKEFEMSLIENFGKTVFLSREEAEQHLKGMVSE